MECVWCEACVASTDRPSTDMSESALLNGCGFTLTISGTFSAHTSASAAATTAANPPRSRPRPSSPDSLPPLLRLPCPLDEVDPLRLSQLPRQLVSSRLTCIPSSISVEGSFEGSDICSDHDVCEEGLEEGSAALGGRLGGGSVGDERRGVLWPLSNEIASFVSGDVRLPSVSLKDRFRFFALCFLTPPLPGPFVVGAFVDWGVFFKGVSFVSSLTFDLGAGVVVSFGSGLGVVDLSEDSTMGEGAGEGVVLSVALGVDGGLGFFLFFCSETKPQTVLRQTTACTDKFSKQGQTCIPVILALCQQCC